MNITEAEIKARELASKAKADLIIGANGVAGGVYSSFVNCINELEILKTPKSVSPTLKPNLPHGLEDANMAHFFDKHHIEYFKFDPKDLVDGDITMFPKGTTEAGVVTQINECLNKFDSAPLTVKGVPDKDGILPPLHFKDIQQGNLGTYEVQIGTITYRIGFRNKASTDRFPELNDKFAIGQFFIKNSDYELKINKINQYKRFFGIQ